MLVNLFAQEVQTLVLGIDIQSHGPVFLNEQVGTFFGHQPREKFVAYHTTVLVLRARTKDNASVFLRLAFTEEVVGNLA